MVLRPGLVGSASWNGSTLCWYTGGIRFHQLPTGMQSQAKTASLTIRENYGTSPLGFELAEELVQRALVGQAIASFEDPIWIVLLVVLRPFLA